MGDVSGKGVSAALLGAAASAEIRRMLQTSCSASRIAAEANRVVHARSIRGMFVTLAAVMLDLNTGAGTFVSAGHLPLLHYEAASGSASLQDGWKGPPAGVVPDAEFPDAGIRLAPGDRLALYTDGLVEALDPSSEEAGLRKLQKIMEDNATHEGTLEEVILQACQSRRATAPRREDDLSYLEVYRASEGS